MKAKHGTGEQKTDFKFFRKKKIHLSKNKHKYNQSCLICVTSPFRHASLDAAGAAQGGQSVFPVCANTSSSAAQTHVDGLAAGVHAAYRGVAHAACSAMSTQRAFPALGRGATEGGAPRQTVGGSSGGVDRAGTGGL